MNYPYICIESDGGMNTTKVWFVKNEEVWIDLSSVITCVHWCHQAGEMPMVGLTVPQPVLKVAAKDIQAALQIYIHNGKRE